MQFNFVFWDNCSQAAKLNKSTAITQLDTDQVCAIIKKKNILSLL